MDFLLTTIFRSLPSPSLLPLSLLQIYSLLSARTAHHLLTTPMLLSQFLSLYCRVLQEVLQEAKMKIAACIDLRTSVWLRLQCGKAFLAYVWSQAGWFFDESVRR